MAGSGSSFSTFSNWPTLDSLLDERSALTHPDLAWARCGAMHLTGRAEGPPLLAPAPFASRAHEVLAAVTRLAHEAALPHAARLADIDGAALLGERAACSGFARHGTMSAGGSCRLLRCGDGWLALNLARTDDVALVPAWLEVSPALAASNDQPPWEAVGCEVRERSVVHLVGRGRSLGLPIAPVLAPAAQPWCRIAAHGEHSKRARGYPPLVLDLSSLWAGPLCAHLLSLAGARVLKVESTRRPDGARFGPPSFYDLLNAGKESVALDFATSEGRCALRALVERADIVIESSRPRALAQLGIDAEALVRTRPGIVWVAITGYGRRAPQCDWVAFGDDASAAAGLVAAMAQGDGEPLFCGDALPDPLTGMHAAFAVLAAWRDGAAALLDLSLVDVTAHVLSMPSSARTGRVRARTSAGHADGAASAAPGWEVVVDDEVQEVLAPHARSPRESARPLGADTAAVLRELGVGAAMAC